MWKNLSFLIKLCLLATVLLPYKLISQNKDSIIRETINIDKNWKFKKGNPDKAQFQDYDDTAWKDVDIPHDWRIHEDYDKNNRRKSGYLPKDMGWYRKKLDVKPEYEGKRIYISFDGVFRNYTVFVNGEKVGAHLSGYTGSMFDITDFIDFSSNENLLSIKVDNEESKIPEETHPQSEYGAGKEGWWYEGYGIYRHVNLIVTNPVHIPKWGTFAYTKNESHDSSDVYVKTQVENTTNQEHRINVKTSIQDPHGTKIDEISGNDKIEEDDEITIQQKTNISNPELWSPEHPNLYSIITEIYSDGKKTGTYKTPLGIRWFRFSADDGFYLNANHLKLKGMNIHAGFGGLGTALPDRANYKNVELAKEMGANIIRSAHNDPAPALMEAADELGILMIPETRYLGKDTVATKSLHDLIKRNRNHPSAIAWSLANNSGRNDSTLTEMLAVMNGITKKLDPTRPTMFGSEANGDPNETGFAFITDIMGYNGGGMGRDDPDHKNYPYRKMLISEYASGRGTRGTYKKKKLAESDKDTLGDGRVFDTGYLYSIYDLSEAHEKEWKHIAERPWLAGGIMWSGIEYIGESNGWPVVTSQFGVFDIARFKKDTYYYYRQEWTDKPMVHILPSSWNFDKQDSIIDVWSYSNCDEVELFLNGESLGKKEKEPHEHTAWEVPYEPGSLLAKGYNEKGEVAAETGVKTADHPYKITAEADRDTIIADAQDLSFITIKIKDKNGTLVPNADNTIHVKAEGGRLLGLSSGNPTAHVDPATNEMKAFNGKLLAILQSGDQMDDIKVTFNAENLKSLSIIIHAK